jgi:hypothetical protein
MEREERVWQRRHGEEFHGGLRHQPFDESSWVYISESET